MIKIWDSMYSIFYFFSTTMVDEEPDFDWRSTIVIYSTWFFCHSISLFPISFHYFIPWSSSLKEEKPKTITRLRQKDRPTTTTTTTTTITRRTCMTRGVRCALQSSQTCSGSPTALNCWQHKMLSPMVSPKLDELPNKPQLWCHFTLSHNTWSRDQIGVSKFVVIRN